MAHSVFCHQSLLKSLAIHNCYQTYLYWKKEIHYKLYTNRCHLQNASYIYLNVDIPFLFLSGYDKISDLVVLSSLAPIYVKDIYSLLETKDKATELIQCLRPVVCRGPSLNICPK